MRRPTLHLTGAAAGLAFLSAGVLAVCLWKSWRVCCRADEHPRLRIATVERDFGAVLEGALLQHSFELHNAGGRRAVIRQLGCSSCGEADAESLIIAPGETATIELVVPARGAQGLFRHVRHYSTSDPLQPHLDLTLAARIEPDAGRTPTLAPPVQEPDSCIDVVRDGL